MNYYREYGKPQIEDVEFFGKDYYDAQMEQYNRLKEIADTIVIGEGTDDEKLLVNVNELGEFIITSVSRVDFEGRGYKSDKLTDADMLHIADKMSDNYVEFGGFWEDIDFWAEEYCLEPNEIAEDNE